MSHTGWTGPPPAPCGTCGEAKPEGAQRCDGCFAVEANLSDYLRRGGVAARTFVSDALRKERAR